MLSGTIVRVHAGNHRIAATRDACVRAALALAVAAAGAGGRAEEPAAAPQPFQPGEISIGEPVVAPFSRPPQPLPEPTRAESTPAATRAANGWLGFVVAPSATPGRWALSDVAAGGPAAGAGIRDGDELRAINGTTLHSFDEVTQAITAIAAGDRVQLAVARGEAVQEVTIVAVPRPSQPAARNWPPPPRFEQPAAGLTTPAAGFTTPAAEPPDTAADRARPSPAPVVPMPAHPPTLAESPATLAAARGRTALGVRTIPIDRDIQSRFRLDEPAGAYVVGVVGDLPASKAGIPPGSVIVALGERPVRSPAELTQLVARGPIDRPVSLAYVTPDGARRRADVVLQSLELPLERALTGETPPAPVEPPALQPRHAHRVVRRESEAVRDEIGRLRTALEALERRLDEFEIPAP